MGKEPKRNVYVGHRYVPKVMGEWEKTEMYEGLSIVTHQGTSYTSKKRVPVGIDILNEEYWVVTGKYNAQVENYRQDVRNIEEQVDSEIGRLDQKDENITTQLTHKADKTFVDSEIGRLDQKDENITTQLTQKVDVEDLPSNMQYFKAIHITERLPNNSNYSVNDVVFTYDNLINWDPHFWEKGSMDGTTGTEQPSETRIRSVRYFEIDPTKNGKVFTKDGGVSILQFKSDGTFLGTSGWLNDGGVFTFDPLTRKIRVLLHMYKHSVDINTDFPKDTSKPVVTLLYGGD